ncbi:MAG: OsmC family peroxiredoxin, partial [Pseudomonadota bacterium]
MGKLGEDIIGTSGLAPFFEVANAKAVTIDAPENRKGDALRTWVRSLSGFQKEALIKSAKTGQTWRLVSDEGPYLNGHDAAPCPLAFLSTGMAASFMNEILALAKIQGVDIRKLKLIQDNYYTMKGSMPKRTMVGGAENIDLQVEIDCDLDDAKLNEFLINATFASPLNGLMRGQLESLFKLGKNGHELPTAKVAEIDTPLFPDPGNHFAKAEAMANDLTLMEPVGPTPKKDVVLGTASGGSSLADEQDRRLNIGAVAVMREDGL